MAEAVDVCVLSRANWASIATLVHHLAKAVPVRLVVGGSAILDRYGKAARYFGEYPSVRVACHVEGGQPADMARTAGLATIELGQLWEASRPRAVVVVGDRHEVLGAAVAAAYSNIPLVHTMGGERSGSIDDKVRDAISSLADLHLVATHAAGDRVRLFARGRVRHIGCPRIDIAATVEPSAPRGYLVVLYHPDTTRRDNRFAMQAVVSAVQAIRMPVEFFWPCADAGHEEVVEVMRSASPPPCGPAWQTHRTMPPRDFLRLLAGADCVVGNSSAALREGSFLGIPAVDVGTRQDGRERGENVVHVEAESEMIETAIRRQLAARRYASSRLYGNGNAGVLGAGEIMAWLG